MRRVLTLGLVAMLGCASHPEKTEGAGGGAGNGEASDATRAVEAVVSGDEACTSLTGFYWEIGDATGMLAHGVGGTRGGDTPDANTELPLASASKWLFGAWALETLAARSATPDAGQVQLLNFTSGHDALALTRCILGVQTVNDCLAASNGDGGSNGDVDAAHVGRFSYNGGHLEVLAQQLGLGGHFKSDAWPAHEPRLADAISQGLGGGLSLRYANAVLAGGGSSSAATYAVFLRRVLSGSLRMHDALGAHAVCAWTGASDCDAVFSPVNRSTPASATNDLGDERWHYSLGHWVEDDPTVGDGAFSSAGASGFYPWIDSERRYYGILARRESVLTGDDVGVASVACGRKLRAAWLAARR